MTASTFPSRIARLCGVVCVVFGIGHGEDDNCLAECVAHPDKRAELIDLREL
jgi:hypothetical protein